MRVEERLENKLLQTIRLKLDSKEQLSIAMPRPRYMETVAYPERGKSVAEQEEEVKDWHNVSLRKELHEREKLPKIGERREKMYSEIGGKEKESMINRLMEPIKVEEEYRMKGKPKRYKRGETDKKLPLILHGRLKSLSPETIVKILQQEKDKQRVYSIIGKI